MDNIGTYLLGLMEDPRVWTALRAVILLIAGFIIARLLGRLSLNLLEPHLDRHRAVLIQRLIFYVVLALFIVSVMHELGFHIGVLIGTAGILSVAIGFASQTSASNIISGLFLLGERPFVVGDIIKFNDITGEVLSIDLLSVKLRTFDNLYVRLPNEQLIKSATTTLTRFPIRRYDLLLGVAYKEDLVQVREILMQVAEDNPLCLEDPAGMFIFQGFADSALSIQFSVWAKRENFLQLRNTIAEDVKAAFDRNNIEIPFPHRTLYAGSRTEPFPVRISKSK